MITSPAGIKTWQGLIYAGFQGVNFNIGAKLFQQPLFYHFAFAFQVTLMGYSTQNIVASAAQDGFNVLYVQA
ncbi:MAG: hypothetical protein RR260_06125 [Clostridia bacterium]